MSMQAAREGLVDQTGCPDKPGIVEAEVPAKGQWCPIRKTVFDWTRTKFPFHIRSAKTLKVNQAAGVTVFGCRFG